MADKPRDLEALSKDIPWGMDGYQYRWLDELIQTLEARIAVLEQRTQELQRRV